MLLRGEGPEADIQEHEEGGAADVSADRGNVVPTREGIGIVRIAARHAGEAKEVLWEEYQVDAHEGHPEMHPAPELRVWAARHLADPVVEAAEDREHRAKRQHVVEVRDDVVGVVNDLVDAGIGADHAGDASE